jgi:hypothetical protein
MSEWKWETVQNMVYNVAVMLQYKYDYIFYV